VSHKHIVSSYEEELQRLGSQIAEMGRLAASQLEAALDALERRDVALADEIRTRDAEVDALEREIGEAALKALALRQPMAVDLREVVSAVKISSDLERIGDLAKNTAKRAHVIGDDAEAKVMPSIARLGGVVREHLVEAIAAYQERDAARALAVWRSDEEVDDGFHRVFRELLTGMMENPRSVTAGTHLLFVAKNVERIGDHTANIAETIHYLVEGESPPESRPKGEDTAYTVVEPPSR
jgi:phosphate transport system protein